MLHNKCYARILRSKLVSHHNSPALNLAYIPLFVRNPMRSRHSIFLPIFSILEWPCNNCSLRSFWVSSRISWWILQVLENETFPFFPFSFALEPFSFQRLPQRIFEKCVCVRLRSYSSEPTMLIALPMASSLHFTHPSQVLARLAPPLWCCSVPLLPVRAHPYGRMCTTRVSALT